jgi:type IV pilus assembly protein PilP
MNNYTKIICLCYLFFCANTLLSNHNSAFASVEITPNNSIPVKSETTGNNADKVTIEFEYQLEGRPDPFTPFISDRAATQALGQDEIVDENVELTGMRQFEPGQLSLVAIMHNTSHAMGMVEDVTGKGYFIKEGMPIGRRGVISKIAENQVTITETAHTRAGRKLENTIVMRLKKEGDK